MKAELVSTLPDEAYCSSDSSDLSFTGLVMVEDWHGNYIKGFWHNEGQIENIKLKEGNNKTDSETCIVTEYYDCVSYDGGYFWTCSLYDYDQTCFSGTGALGGGDYPPSGGGSSGSNTGSGHTNDNPEIEDTSRDLNEQDSVKLERIKLELLKAYCPNQGIFSSVWNTLNFQMDKNLGSKAFYNPVTGTITFKNYLSINNATVLQEVFHAYQNFFYTGGTAQYVNNGKVNIEFEAWVYTDVWLYIDSKPLNFGENLPKSLQLDYDAWILEIASNGFSSAALQEYEYWLGIFYETFPQYRSPMNPDLELPGAAMDIFDFCYN